MGDYSTPKKSIIQINEEKNAYRLDSGNYPKEQRKANSFTSYDYAKARENKAMEDFKRVQRDIFNKPVPSGEDVSRDLFKLKEYRKWGGLLKRKSRKSRRTIKSSKSRKSRRTIKSRKSRKSRK